MNAVIEHTGRSDPKSLLGVFRRFRNGGPAYEVIAINPEQRTATIRVLESGEELDYPLEKIAEDDDA